MTQDFYRPGTSLIHRWNPVTTLSLSLTLVVTAFASQALWLPAALLVFVVFPAALVSGVFRRLLAWLARFLLPVILLLFVIQGLYHQDGPLLDLGPVGVHLDGVLFATRTALRLLVLTGAFLLLLFTTHPGELMTALVAHGMPPKISYLVSATMQIVPAFRQRAHSILDAQRARGLRTAAGPIGRVRALVPLVGPLVLGALSEVDERAVAMEARAFGATTRRTSYTVIADSAAQRVSRWSMLVITIAVIVLSATGVIR
ncbi:MAG: energy-coupling factor transporter transmembrane protein EcfT [Kutzneria sp.]|nr:energy-coupling factor transporter transmembrane protein EcfT [Kutzneria sp.]